jgi:DNA polymerase-3 subunit gamma/tau
MEAKPEAGENMGHLALYRAWRPQAFADVVGQDMIVQTLKNALAEGRFTHAYLFSGPRGTGKTTAAKLFAKAVNCLKGPAPEPCNECAMCRRIADGSHVDVIELDAASNNGVDEIRDIREKVKYAPTEARYKVYIIDEVHMLTIGAFNALLKTLEEPPPHVIFILATTEPHKLPVTIVSRCQRYDFRRIAPGVIVDRLKTICRAEGIEAEERALWHLARLADGGMRDALSLLDQTVAFNGRSVTLHNVVAITGSLPLDEFAKMAEAALAGDVGTALDLTGKMLDAGKNAEKCLEDFIAFYRDALLVKLLPERAEPGGGADGVDGIRRRIAEAYSRDQLFRAIELLLRASGDMKYAAQPGVVFEVALLKLCTGLSGSGGADGTAAAGAGAAPAAGTSADGSPCAALPGTPGAGAPDAAALAALERRLAALEAKLAAGAAAPGESAAARPGPAPSRRPSAAASGVFKPKPNLEPFLNGGEDELRDITTRWAELLAKVKERKISVHAWLRDGEPVAATGNEVLVAFKNVIHRETTEKPDNRRLIEQAMAETYRRPLVLRTVMLGEWQEAKAAAGQAHADAAGARPPDLALEAPEPDGGEPPWVRDAIDLFGADMVVIKED